ncbi:hemin uptake protein HemP [Methyloraptor flagellatus]|jgi:hemin uptake protein HemP|uniref:Hemin uptake protein HemP n=1 Tax=Methyloraptor flagellatus TaxID=3162530 RepID=A0AAU7XB86_9HYPH
MRDDKAMETIEVPAAADASAGPPVVDAADLLGETRQILIAHRGEHYRLRITSNDKLILTK